MHRLRRLFVWLFVLSVVMGVVHELSPDHQHGEPCEVCILAHAPALIHDAAPSIVIDYCFEPFASAPTPHLSPLCILNRSRSPPLT